MRGFRVFNDIDQVDVEWTIQGMRWRMSSACLLFSSPLLGAVAAVTISIWLGVTVCVVLAATIFLLVRAVNGMDPAGHLHEFTQIGLLLRTWARPLIDNSGRR